MRRRARARSVRWTRARGAAQQPRHRRAIALSAEIGRGPTP
jgi:hypothetical protein